MLLALTTGVLHKGTSVSALMASDDMISYNMQAKPNFEQLGIIYH